MKLEIGHTAKHKQWSWGGEVVAINHNTKTVFICVGNRDTGEIYPVGFSDCQIKDPGVLTTSFINILPDNAICDGCGYENKIVDSLSENGKEVNVCESCESRGGYICFNCPQIHFAQYACPKYQKAA